MNKIIFAILAIICIGCTTTLIDVQHKSHESPKQNDVFYNPSYNEFNVVSLLTVVIYTNRYQLTLAQHKNDDFLPLFLMTSSTNNIIGKRLSQGYCMYVGLIETPNYCTNVINSKTIRLFKEIGYGGMNK